MSGTEIDRSNDHPYRVGLLLIDGFALMSFASVVEPLRAANLIADRALYDIAYVAAAPPPALSSSGAEIPAVAIAAAPADLDLILVIAGGDPLPFHDAPTFQWLRRQAGRGVRIGGVSGGPAVLVNAGLMGGRRMTIHWEHAAALAEHHPALLLERSLFVIDRDRLTCAGGTAPLDMMHAVIAAHHGAGFARQVSDWFMHTAIRPAGDPQRAGLVERYGVYEPSLVTAIGAMETHLSDPLRLEQLARLADVSTRHLNRLFRNVLGRSAMAFYRDLRLDQARNLLVQSDLRLTEIALATGFANSAHFSSAFRTRFGMPPSSIRQRSAP